MSDEDIEALKQAVSVGLVYYINDDCAMKISHIGEHAEEGPGFPCAIGAYNKYIALWNAERNQFYSVISI